MYVKKGTSKNVFDDKKHNSYGWNTKVYVCILVNNFISAWTCFVKSMQQKQKN